MLDKIPQRMKRNISRKNKVKITFAKFSLFTNENFFFICVTNFQPNVWIITHELCKLYVCDLCVSLCQFVYITKDSFPCVLFHFLYHILFQKASLYLNYK